MLYKVHVEATVYDEETLDYLLTDEGWLSAMKQEAREKAVAAGKTVLSSPDLVNHSLVTTTDDGLLYDFEFNVQVA